MGTLIEKFIVTETNSIESTQATGLVRNINNEVSHCGSKHCGSHLYGIIDTTIVFSASWGA